MKNKYTTKDLEREDLILSVKNMVDDIYSDSFFNENRESYNFFQNYINTNQSIFAIEQKQSIIVNGTISNIKRNVNDVYTEALFEISPKHTAFCNLLKEPKEIVNALSEGDSCDIKIYFNKNGYINASISDAIEESKIRDIISSIEDENTAYECIVEELTNGGYWVKIDNIRCFMPGSLAGLNKLYDFSSLVGNKLIVMPVTFSNERNTIVVSHRKYLQKLQPQALENLKDNIKEKQIGFVTGTTENGVFVEFNECLTGLINKDELNERTEEKFKQRSIKPGDILNFWVKEIISNKKIKLSQRGPFDTKQDILKEKYPIYSVQNGKIKEIRKYGVFVELDQNTKGLIHKSKLKGKNYNKNEEIMVKVISIDNNKLYLSPYDES